MNKKIPGRDSWARRSGWGAVLILLVLAALLLMSSCSSNIVVAPSSSAPSTNTATRAEPVSVPPPSSGSSNVVLPSSSLPPSTNTTVPGGTEPVPADFYWPPLFPSAFRDITAELERSAGRPRTLGDAGIELQQLLQKSGYAGSTFCRVPLGFALVTRIERINADGSPRNADRWELATALRPFRGSNLLEYLGTLEDRGSGLYRVLVFVVTSWDLWANSDEHSGGSSDNGWADLPSAIASTPWTDAFRCTVLVYEFKVIAGSPPKADLVTDGLLSGEDHLRRAGILH